MNILIENPLTGLSMAIWLATTLFNIYISYTIVKIVHSTFDKEIGFMAITCNLLFMIGGVIGLINILCHSGFEHGYILLSQEGGSWPYFLYAMGNMIFAFTTKYILKTKNIRKESYGRRITH